MKCSGGPNQGLPKNDAKTETLFFVHDFAKTALFLSLTLSRMVNISVTDYCLWTGFLFTAECFVCGKEKVF